jgi:hypothetical protein
MLVIRKSQCITCTAENGPFLNQGTGNEQAPMYTHFTLLVCFFFEVKEERKTQYTRRCTFRNWSADVSILRPPVRNTILYGRKTSSNPT